jgi:hypothetical protein
MKKLINWLLTPYHRYKERQSIKQRLKELREKDPYIYK